ncbi:MAG: type IV pilus modification PilV family protein [Actinomycetota bacterium]
MMRRRFGFADEGGFSMIEVVAAMLVFSFVAMATAALLTSSVRGAGVSRSLTVGKSMVSQAMERARGLPYFVDYPTQKSYSNNLPPFRKVDLLDLYYPSYDASGTYVTECPASNDPNPACPREMPDGYSVEFRARFVEPVGGAQETYQTVMPDPAYRWNPDPYTTIDEPESHMLELTVIGKWEFAGRNRSFGMTSLIGDHEYGQVTVSGFGRTDYLVQVSTAYTDEFSGDEIELDAQGGFAESLVQTKTASTSDQSVRAATLALIDPSLEDNEIASVEGAVSGHHAPPDTLPAGETAPAADLVHPDLGPVAGIDGTLTKDLKVSVSQELPTAEGTFAFDAPTGTERLLWASAQAENVILALFGMDSNEGMVSFEPRAGKTLSGASQAVTESVQSFTRRVETSASAEFGRLRLFKTDFIDGSITDSFGVTTFPESVVVIDDFDASVSCKSTASVSGPNAASADRGWSATLYYWEDDQNDGIVQGSYESVSLSSSNNPDPLASVRSANPLVFDGLIPAEDVYLFEKAKKDGYLKNWSSLEPGTASVDPDGRVTQAAIDAAVSINTATMHSLYENSSLSIQIGKLTCEASDQR